MSVCRTVFGVRATEGEPRQPHAHAADAPWAVPGYCRLARICLGCWPHVACAVQAAGLARHAAPGAARVRGLLMGPQTQDSSE